MPRGLRPREPVGPEGSVCPCRLVLADVACLLAREFPELGAAAVEKAMSPELLLDVLTAALTELFGIVGGAVPVSLLQLQGFVGTLRIDAKYVIKASHCGLLPVWQTQLTERRLCPVPGTPTRWWRQLAS